MHVSSDPHIDDHLSKPTAPLVSQGPPTSISEGLLALHWLTQTVVGQRLPDSHHPIPSVLSTSGLRKLSYGAQDQHLSPYIRNYKARGMTNGVI